MMKFKKALKVFSKNHDIWDSDRRYQPDEILKIRSQAHCDTAKIRKAIFTIQQILNNRSLVTKFDWLIKLGCPERSYCPELHKGKNKSCCVKLGNDLGALYRHKDMWGYLPNSCSVVNISFTRSSSQFL